MKKFCVDVYRRLEDDAAARLAALDLDYELVSRAGKKSRFMFGTDKNDEALLAFIGQMAVVQGGYPLAARIVRQFHAELDGEDLRQLKPFLEERIKAEEKRLAQAVRWDLRHLSWPAPMLDIEGYLRFAAHGLGRSLKLLVADEVESYLARREEADFAEMLRFFVDMQDYTVNEAHIFVDGRRFEIEDERGSDLKKAYLAGAELSEADRHSISQEDLIMSILITLVPKKIVVHFVGDRDASFLKMTEMVFADRLVICSGCERCLGAGVRKR